MSDAMESLLQSVATAEKLKTKSNDELADIIEEHVWADFEMCSAQSVLLGEVMDRLRNLKTCASCHGWGYVEHARCVPCSGTGDVAPPADAATEDNGYAPTIADARMHIERLTRSLSQPHSADERFFAINEARTWLAKTAAAKADAATEAVNRLSPIATEPVARAAEIVRERLRIYGNTSTYLYDCPGLVAEVTDLLDALAAPTPAPAPSADRCAAGHDWIRRGEGSCGDRYVCLRCGERKP